MGHVVLVHCAGQLLPCAPSGGTRTTEPPAVCCRQLGRASRACTSEAGAGGLNLDHDMSARPGKEVVEMCEGSGNSACASCRQGERWKQ